MQPKIDAYNDFVSQYLTMIGARDKVGSDHDAIVAPFLSVVGDVAGLDVLDAGCGEGYFARNYARRGATVTGIDIASRMLEVARSKELADQIVYYEMDLCQPISDEFHNRFDLIASYFVLNDVYNYQGFLSTLFSVARPGARLVLFLNSPYSFVIRNFVTDYFDTGKAVRYRGMWDHGVKVHFYHHTLEEYLQAALTAGWQLQRLVDVPTPEGTFKRRKDNPLHPEGYHFPYFMILSFQKP